MKRRDVLLGTGAAILSGCANSGPVPETLSDSRVPAQIGSALVQPFDAPMAPIQSTMDRVTRTLVGLRPYRKIGPRLESVTDQDRTIVHNYGHGGGGVSLSWGVAELAADLIKAAGQHEIAVLGSGAVGLSTAILLQRAGANVTVYAQNFPPYTTSNVAGAMWHPVTLFDRGQVSDETMQMLHLASKIAFLRFIRYANDPRYGVYWIRQFSLSNRQIDTTHPYIGGDGLYPGMLRNQQGGPFGFPFYDAYYTLMIDSDIYMRALMNDFMIAGGRTVEHTFETEDDVRALPEKAIVNCMGIGARKVFGDEELIPIRGQLSFLLPQNDIDYGYAGGTSEHGLLYSFPRKTGILLGGSGDRNDWDLQPRESEIRRMVEGHAALAARL